MNFDGYWRAAREPRHSALFAVALLVAYELLAALLGQEGGLGIRNGADVLLRSLAGLIGGQQGVVALGVGLIVGGLVLAMRDARIRGAPRLRVLGGMALESVAWAGMLGVVASALTGLLLGGYPLASGPPPFSLPTAIMLSLGAGYYEELVFRVVLVGLLLHWATRVMRLKRRPAVMLAVILGALAFSAFHYIGPFGDELALGSFAYRTVAGVLLSALYVARGFGIVAWSHALYDVMLMVGAGLA